MIVLLHKTKFEEYVNILALWLQKLLIKKDTDSMILWSWSVHGPWNESHLQAISCFSNKLMTNSFAKGSFGKEAAS